MADQQFNTTVNLDISKFNENLKKIQDQLSSLQKNLDTTSEKTKNIGKHSESTGLSMGKLAGAMGLAIGGYELLGKAASAVSDAIKDGLKNWEKEESFVAKLTLALKGNTNIAKGWEEVRDKLNKNPFVSKDDLNTIIAMGVQMGRTKEQVEKTAEAAIALSRYKNIPLTEAYGELSKTLEGTKGRIGQYDNSLKHLNETQLRHGEALDIIIKKFGAYSTAGGELELKQAQVNKKWEESKEKIGQFFAPAMSGALTLLSKGVDLFDKLFGRVSKMEGATGNYMTDQFAKTEQQFVDGDKKTRDYLLKKQEDTAKAFKELWDKAVAEGNTANRIQYSKMFDQALEQRDKLKKDAKDNPIKTIERDPEEVKKEQERREKEAKEKVDLYQKTQKEIDDATAKANENSLTHEKNLNSEIKLDDKSAFDTQLEAIKKLRDQKVKAKEDELNKLRQVAGPDTEQGAALRAAKEKEIESEIVLIKDQGTKEIQANDQAYFDWENDQNQIHLDATTKNEERITKKKKEEQEKQKKQLQETAQAVGEQLSKLVDVISKFSKASSDKALSNLDTQFNKEYDELDKLHDKKQISDKEYDKKKTALDKKKAQEQDKIKKEQAKKDWEAAIIQATIQTALAVIMAYSTGGGLISGTIMAAIVGAIGALEIAAIVAQGPAYAKGGEVKKYATGGLLSGPSHQSPSGGIPIMAEGGEFVVRKSVAQQPNMVTLLNAINNNQMGGQGGVTATVSKADLRSIVSEVSAIPVNVSQNDITKTQKKVNVIQKNAAW